MHWKNWYVMDESDEPIEWTNFGQYQLSSYGEIDDKQVPMPPKTNPSHLLKDFNKEQKEVNKPIIIPYWINDTLWIYYYNAIPSNTSKIRVISNSRRPLRIFNEQDLQNN